MIRPSLLSLLCVSFILAIAAMLSDQPLVLIAQSTLLYLTLITYEKYDKNNTNY